VNVELQIELVIRGKVEGSHIPAYYWAAVEYTNANGLHSSYVGQRAIHYLIKEKSGFRYVTDIFQSATWVGSVAGSKPQRVAPGEEAASISRLLLAPHASIDAEAFVQTLPDAAMRSLSLVGYSGTLPLLQELLKSDDWRTRWAACKALAQLRFPGEYGCLDLLEPDAHKHAFMQEWNSMVRRQVDLSREFKTQFLRDPITVARSRGVLPGDGGVRDYLMSVSVHPDKDVALRARSELSKR